MRHVKNSIFLLCIVCSIFTDPPCFSQEQTKAVQRKLFWQIRQLLLSGHYQQVEKLKRSLVHYPLFPYLSFIQLKQQLSLKKEREVEHFLQTYKETPLAAQLRSDWLFYLGKKNDWRRFIRYYQPMYDVPLQCEYIQALLMTDQKQIAMKKITSLWLNTSKFPSQCHRVLAYWKRSHGLTHSLICKKFVLAVQKNRFDLIQDIYSYLSRSEQQQVNYWYKLQRNPYLIKQFKPLNRKNPMDRKMLLFGIKTLAYKDPVDLAQAWPSLMKYYPFHKEEKQELFRILAVNLARQGNPSADKWFSQVEAHYTDSLFRAWRIRYNLLYQHWDKVLYWIDHLPPPEKQKICWRYWRARALSETEKNHSPLLYKELANKVDYYGVLSSQRIGLVYRPITHRVGEGCLSLLKSPEIRRAKELYQLGFIAEAQREWLWALNRMNLPQLGAAAQLAAQWKWYSLAIMAAKKAHIVDDIWLRFPKAYAREVFEAARETHLNSVWLWAIIRQESAFAWNAKSSVGALGLMQLMPSTAESVAQDLRLTQVNFLDPRLNIRLGSRYLSYLLKVFNGNALLATASYNIGPTKIRRYHRTHRHLPSDIWVEVLPWKETRNYVKSVFLARNIYRLIP